MNNVQDEEAVGLLQAVSSSLFSASLFPTATTRSTAKADTTKSDKNNKPNDDDDDDDEDAAIVGDIASNVTLQVGSEVAALKNMVESVLPKVEPLPWPTFFCLSVWCAIPAIVYILLFTQMGFGEYIYYDISHSQFADYTPIFVGTLSLLAFFFYILDMDQWNETAVGIVFRFLTAATMFCILLLIVVLISNEVPFGIITFFALINPLWLLAVKNAFYGERTTRTFVSWLGAPLVCISCLLMLSFIVWASADYCNEWNTVMKVDSAEQTGCVADFDDYPKCKGNATTAADSSTVTTCFSLDHSSEHPELIFPEGCDTSCVKVYDSCSNGFILWAGPVLLCLSTVFLSFFCTFLRIEISADEKEVSRFSKLWIFVLIIMWASASLSGAASGISYLLVTLTVANIIGAGILLYAIFSAQELEQSKDMAFSRIKEKYGDGNLNIARGLFVAAFSPLLLAYFCLSAVNQLVRRVGINPCSEPASDVGEDPNNYNNAGFVTARGADRNLVSMKSWYQSDATTTNDNDNGVLTVRAKRHFGTMMNWYRAKVLTYAIYWGILFIVFQVLVAKLTSVFLSWMIEQMAGFGLIAVSGIMAGVGVLMFLLPPVPGLPVYLSLGIVIPAKGHEILGWPGAILYSSGVGLVLKLFSSALQQKGIGENLSHIVKVRQFVNINSKLMKSMRLELGSGGLSVAKVAILIGGPDWPTSVLCGIMRLSLFQIMLGTLPVLFLILPTCLTGALLYMASLDNEHGNPEFPWADTASTLVFSATAMVQLGALLVATYYIERTADTRADEVGAIEDDKEVKEADEKDELMRKCYETVTQWNVIPLWPKVALILSHVSITTSCYMVQFGTCFVEHDLTDSIDENLGGSVANLFLPLGWVVIALFIASMILLGIFSSWGTRQAKKLVESGNAEPLDPQGDL
mmetsp:Transcript_28484/g.59366  ORF Transcript_28484/g.59366 Transcript_28484/m.59366 type:complete len:918 (-) Transcript_28484:195-2948(-)